MKRPTFLVAGTAASALLFAIAGTASAGAYYLQEQSVKANGRAWSGEVAESGVQQLWWNPAAIGGLSSSEGYLGLTQIQPRAISSNLNTRVIRPTLALSSTMIIPSTNQAVGGDQSSSNPIKNGTLPTGGFAIPLNSRWTFGLLATSPYSFTTDYSATSWARYDADKTELRTYDVQPTIAFAPTHEVSLGLGLNAEYMDATLSNFLPDPLSSAYPDGHQSLQGNGWNYGYSVGAQYHSGKIELGASYKSAIKHKLRGSLTISGLADPIALAAGLNSTTSGAHAGFSTPWQAQIGIRYHLDPVWIVEGSIVQSGWRKFDAINVTLPTSTVTTAIPENYKDTTAYSVGADARINAKWTLRGGVQMDKSPIPAGERDPRVPDGDRTTYAVGATYTVNNRAGIDLSLGYTHFSSVAIDKTEAAFAGTALQTVILTSGQLQKAHALTFGIGTHFGF